LLDEASNKGEVPRWQFAFIDDRIRMNEGLPQHYGTQWHDGPDGIEPYPIEDPDHVDERRAALGLPSLDELRASAPREWKWNADTDRKRKEKELAWRRAVGWVR
jgi:hypothetical protein